MTSLNENMVQTVSRSDERTLEDQHNQLSAAEGDTGEDLKRIPFLREIPQFSFVFCFFNTVRPI